MARSKRAVLLRGPERAEHLSVCGGSPRGSTKFGVPPTPRLSHMDDADCCFKALRTPDR